MSLLKTTAEVNIFKKMDFISLTLFSNRNVRERKQDRNRRRAITISKEGKEGNGKEIINKRKEATSQEIIWRENRNEEKTKRVAIKKIEV